MPQSGPPDAVVIGILEAQYAAINAAGGMPVTVTASGRTLLLKPKIYKATVTECRSVPAGELGEFECSLDLMVTLRDGDTRPGKHGERVGVVWDAQAGEWIATNEARARRKRQPAPQ